MSTKKKRKFLILIITYSIIALLGSISLIFNGIITKNWWHIVAGACLLISGAAGAVQVVMKSR